MFSFGQKKKEAAGKMERLPQLGRSKDDIWGGLYGYTPLMPPEYRLYDMMREAVPIIDAAISKTVKLCGGFRAISSDERYQRALDDFCGNVSCGIGGVSLEQFIARYLDCLLCYGNAVGEIVLNADKTAVSYLYNAPLDNLSLSLAADGVNVRIAKLVNGSPVPVKDDALVFYTALGASGGELRGRSILYGLPFVTGILLKVYNSIGQNFERMGNLRYAVTYNPSESDKGYAKERVMSIASEWSDAMNAAKNGEIRDFIAAGDVSIKVIGADNQFIDSNIPVRQMLEQIIAKLGLPPFILGLSWSTTERMSSQQADILTTELDAYRRIITPVIKKICTAYLRTIGSGADVAVLFDLINLQDEVEMARADLMRAQAEKIRREIND